MVFTPEQPAALDDEVLFQSAGVLPGLNAIGDHIVASAQSDRSPSMTFLVSGGFGTGKSSALGYLRGYIGERLTSDVIFAEYKASSYDDKPIAVRSILIYQLVRALDSSEPGRYPVDELIQALTPDTSDALVGFSPESQAMIDRLRLIQAIERGATAAPVLEEWFRHFADRREHRPVTVGLIDDLDRCSYGFTAAVLQATNHWSWLPNHFFLIACGEEHLEKSLATEFPTMAAAVDSGLRKYIHHSVRLPEKLIDRPHSARLVQRVLSEVGAKPDLVQRLAAAVAEASTRPAATDSTRATRRSSLVPDAA